MEEEVGIKGTRLRRRLSIEAEDVKSPSTQSTPTKKRGGRLAAKPQLELIDENVPELIPIKTTKAREIAAEEKILTPSRRSSRIKSNTSIVSETPEVEEKSTPARRTTRVKSNTSIVAEVTSVTTPRAKRAARRNSQVGSDNEAPVTPARQTRRTRKDSTSSVDITADKSDKGSQIKEVIVEETENTEQGTKNETTPKKESPIRKSPRLTEKTLSKISSSQPIVQIEKMDLSKNNKSTIDSKAMTPTKAVEEEKPSEKSNISITSSNLIKEMDDAPKISKNQINKSTNALYDEPIPKTRRNRTKSWTTISVEPSNDNNFSSDSEIFKKDDKKKNKSLNTSNISGSGDGIMNTSLKENEDVNLSVLSDKKNKKRQEKSIVMDNETSEHEASNVNASPKLKKATEVISADTSVTKGDKKEIKSLNTSKQIDSSGTDKLFEQAPAELIKSLVYIDDSDSNHGSIGKGNTEKDFDSGDQCVPVVVHDLGANETIKEATNNLSYEPMDVDETLPENISSTFSQNNNSIKLNDKEKEKRKSTLNISQIKDDSLLNSKGKLSKSNLVSTDTLDGSPNLSNRKSLEKSTVNDDSITKSSKTNTSILNVSTIDNTESDANKSKRNSSTTDNGNVNDESMDDKMDMSKKKTKSHVVPEDSKNSSTTSATALAFHKNADKSLNISKRRSSLSALVSEAMDKRKSSDSDPVIDEDVMNKSSNKSKRKSNAYMVPEDNINKNSSTTPATGLAFDENKDESLNISKRRSSVSEAMGKGKASDSDYEIDEDVINKSSNKSKRKSKSLMVPEDSINKNSSTTSATALVFHENMEKSQNVSKRRSSVSVMVSEAMDKRKSSNSDSVIDEDVKNKSSNKSKGKKSILNEVHDDTVDKSLSKSKRKSSIAQDTKENHDKTDNDNKSTLVLSEIKDLSQSESNVETNIPKECNESNLQLSKSVTVPNVTLDKETAKKDLSLTYLTSTPLQQKSLKTLSMQINSSIITPSSTKKNKENASRNSTKEASIVSQEDSNSSSEEDSSDEESSVEKSNMIDDEAEEASADYESGDSRDEDEKDYEKQNEFVEKGETLETDDEDEYSDDDYEKDSFIVSSDEEDIDLLSGSGDDLDMSANELSMSAKSKKIYNERKRKEQKNASREMFEARHESKNSPEVVKSKSKKNNRQRFVSTTSESNNEDVEIDKEDPLSLQNVIKVEPKTPQKDLNISTVAVTSVDKAEEVNVDENVTILESNQTSDPLQTTSQNADIGEDDEADDSISENEELTKNYESMLNNLNKITPKKNKSLDTSLNIHKKTKQKKSKEPIMDQLNLTQVTKSKKKQSTAVDEPKKMVPVEKAESTEKDKQTLVFSEGSSDSIDMKLLFPEDSNDSEAIVIAKDTKNEQAKENIQKEENIEVADDFIPLKRTDGKTNIFENTETDNKSMDESGLNVSSKKKNKRKSAQVVDSEDMNDQETNLNFFIDTTGNLTDIPKTDVNTSVKSSAKKNKKKNNVSFVDIEERKLDNDSDDAPLEVSYQSNKNTTQIEEQTTANESPSQSAKKKKKNKKKGLNNSQIEEHNLFGNTDKVADKSNTSITDGGAKKKKKLSESQVEQETEIDTAIPVQDFSFNSSKKKKQGIVSANCEAVKESKDNVAEKSNASITDGSAKKKKKKLSESQVEQETAENDTAIQVQNVPLSSSKKKKQRKASESCEVVNESKGDKDVNNEDTSKKRKRKSSANQTIDEIIIKDDLKLDTSKTLNDSTVNQKKKRKISHDNDKTEKSDAQELDKESQEKAEVKKARKKNKSAHEAVNGIDDDAIKNKKRKERDDDNPNIISKVFKQNSFDKVHVPRLPANLLQQLDDKPKTDTLDTKKPKAVSTSTFVVEQTKKRKTKPSNYLEESVYINDSVEERKQKGSVKNPKVLPFIPTASTSEYGFTTNFRVNVIQQQTQFVAQSSGIANFKNDYLSKKRIKKLGTFEKFKRQRSVKLSKF